MEENKEKDYVNNDEFIYDGNKNEFKDDKLDKIKKNKKDYMDKKWREVKGNEKSFMREY